MRRDGEEGEGGKPEGEADRDAGEDGDRHGVDEEDDQIQIAEGPQHRSGEDEGAGNGEGHRGGEEHAQAGRLGEANEGEQNHQHRADRQRGCPPCIRNAERRRGDEALLGRIFISRL
jgi:hypothetical protein